MIKQIKSFPISFSFAVILFSVSLLGFISVPKYVGAQDTTQLASNCNEELLCYNSAGEVKDCGEAGLVHRFSDPCGFDDVIGMISDGIRFIVKLSLPILAIGFAIAGGMYLSSVADPGKRAKAKTLMTTMLYGILIIISAWLIVEAIFKGLGYDVGVILFH